MAFVLAYAAATIVSGAAGWYYLNSGSNQPPPVVSKEENKNEIKIEKVKLPVTLLEEIEDFDKTKLRSVYIQKNDVASSIPNKPTTEQLISASKKLKPAIKIGKMRTSVHPQHTFIPKTDQLNEVKKQLKPLNHFDVHKLKKILPFQAELQNALRRRKIFNHC